MMTRRLICLVAFLLVQTTDAAEVIQQTPAGGINWSKGMVFAHGYGTAKPGLSAAQKRILSRRAAVVDAQRNLLEITRGVRISSQTTTGQAMEQHREIATRVEGIIKGARIVKDHYQNDVATVTMSMPLAGEFLRVMYPRGRIADGRAANAALLLLDVLIPRALADEWIDIESESEANAYRKLLQWMDDHADADLGTILQESVVQFEATRRFSGLLIDASGVPEFELATIPKIRDEKGEIIYPGEETSYDDIVNKRGVSYDFDLRDAIRNKRVARTPLIVKAISTYKSLPSDLVISSGDAVNIRRSPGTLQAMNKAGVLIVVAL